MKDESEASRRTKEAKPQSSSMRESFEGLDSPPQLSAHRKACCDRFTKCFNFVDNFYNLNKPRSKAGDQELEVFNAVRVVSSIMIILG